MNFLAGARLSSRRILSPPPSTKRLLYLRHIPALQQRNFCSAKATTTVPKTQRSTKPRSHKSYEKPSQTINKPMEAMATVWPKPQLIPYQAKVANFVNFMGNVKIPVRFETDSVGKHFSATVISLGNEVGSLSIPVVFEGDLAHVVACHVKENDCVFVSGQLSGHPLRWLLSESYGKFHVVAENLNFVVGFEKSVLGRKMGVDGPGRLRDRVGDGVDSDRVLGVEVNSVDENSSRVEVVQESVAAELPENGSSTSWGSDSKMKDANHPVDLWINLAKNPLQWWDYRGHKKNGLVKEKFPDFKQKVTGEPLWISSAPKWILPEVRKLEFDVKEMKPEKALGGERHSDTKQSISLEHAWKSLVENPDKWWDNRARKTNSRAPDFRHKETGDVLWVNSSPDWALSKLPPIRGGQNSTA